MTEKNTPDKIFHINVNELKGENKKVSEVTNNDSERVSKSDLAMKTEPFPVSKRTEEILILGGYTNGYGD